jgi:hypothetical protein
MPRKSSPAGAPDDVVEILHHILKHMDERFEEVFTRLDRIEFLVSGQERRISILEDRMRVVATKLGLEFRQQV